MEKSVYIEGLGEVVFRRNSRAKRYVLRVSNRQIVATLPMPGNEKRMIDFIESRRDKLIRMLEIQPAPNLLDENSVLETFTFRLHIFRTSRAHFYMTLKEGVLHIACPEHTDFKATDVQQLLRQMLKKALRSEAGRVLPARLQTLAERHGFRYASTKINDARTRWGSCSSRKNINLSLSLLLLPEHLIDYVLLHELCHTVEMNHSRHFWQLLDKVTDNRSQALRRELKRFKSF